MAVHPQVHCGLATLAVLRPRILIAAGEASGDLYASKLVEALRARMPEAEFFGCTGPRMRAAGVRTVVDAASLAVVGLFEVVSHIPRIYREFRKLVAAAEAERPDVAILTDSPDFNLRVAKRLKRLGVPVVYLIAPQVWAWRRGRLPGMRRMLRHLLCIFPFEEQFFREHGIEATYIGHPLAHFVRPTLSRQEFRSRYGLDGAEPVIALLPGSRHGEVARHLKSVLDAAARIAKVGPARFLLALPAGQFVQLPELTYFTERNPEVSIQVIEGMTWDVLAWSDLALAASGTVTVEAALLGTPTVTFYRVSRLSWLAGKFLVRVPFYSMPNLIAGRAVIPELMQNEMSGERLAEEALRLLDDEVASAAMRQDLATVAARLAAGDDPMARAAVIIEDIVRQSSEKRWQ